MHKENILGKPRLVYINITEKLDSVAITNETVGIQYLIHLLTRRRFKPMKHTTKNGIYTTLLTFAVKSLE